MFKFPSVPAYSFSHKYKGLQSMDAPGPGAYDLNQSDKIINKKSPGTVLGSAAREGLKKSYGPGPGAYDNSNILEKPKGGYMGIKKITNIDGSVPGPGAYDFQGEVNVKRGNIGYSFGKGRGLNFDKSGAPGPGAYDVSNLNAPMSKSVGTSLGKAARNYLKASEIPGPGAYD